MRQEFAIAIPACWPMLSDGLSLTVTWEPDPEFPCDDRLACVAGISLSSFSASKKFGCDLRHFRHFTRGLASLARGDAGRISLVDTAIETRLEIARTDDPSRYSASLVLSNPARWLHEKFRDSPRIELPGFTWERSQLHRAAFHARKFLVEVEMLTGQRPIATRARGR